MSKGQSQGSLPFKKRRLQFSAPLSPKRSRQSPENWNVQDENKSLDPVLYSKENARMLQTLRCFFTSELENSATQGNRCSSEPMTFPGMKRPQLPHLVSPMPNGCHGRTARKKSFCRKLPCYNGSNYCKLHYQQYVANEKLPSGEEEPCELRKSTPDPAVQKHLAIPNIAHQDRRFNGSPDQVRCLATTTRGRPCTYVAVDPTKYCYLHAGYEKDPSTKQRNSALEVETESNSGLDENNNRVHRRDPYLSGLPLLSALPTGKWMNQLVVIATGHLQYHSGVVERWGNGWVSVRIPGLGLHNRRAFELHIVPNTGGNSKMPFEEMLCSLQNQDMPLSMFSNRAYNDKAGQSSTSRSFSVSPVPTAGSSGNGHLVSPETQCSVRQW
eukprot:scaffold1505_cov118-Cylindrotheca_fusiformis.AAC.1